MAKRPLQDFSQLDNGQIIKNVHEERASALRVSDANSEVPAGYSKVDLTLNDDANSVIKAIFYGGKTAEKTRIKFFADNAGSLNNKYFYINGTEDKTLYYVWFNVDGAGTDPKIAGRCGIEVPISINDDAYFVARTTEIMLKALDDFVIQKNGSDVLLVENVELGTTTNATDINTGFGVTTTQEGSTERIKSLDLPEEDGVRYIFNHAERKFETISDIQGQVKIEGLDSGQNLELDVNTSTWTEVVIVVPADRDTISVNIQNPDTNSNVKVSFNNSDEKGMLIYQNGGERQYVVKKTIMYYFKAIDSDVTLNIEVLS